MSPSRRILILVFCLAASLAALPGALADTGPEREMTAGPVPDPLADPDFLARAREYTRGLIAFRLADTAWSILLLAWLTFSGLSSRAWTWIRERSGEGFTGKLIFLAGFLLFLSLASLPIDFYYGFLREHTYGFSAQRVSGWFADRAKGLGVTVAVFALFTFPLYAVIRRFPRSWWLLGAGLTCVLATFMIAVAPVAVAPLFNEFTPLEDAELRETILQLARENGIAADEVFQVNASARSSHDNAYVTGLLGTKRIVLSDNLLENYTRDELAFVMGHEMGHYVMHHLWATLGIMWILTFLSFLLVRQCLRLCVGRWRSRTGFSSEAGIDTLPAILLTATLALFVTMPIQNAFSRMMEAEADQFALEVVAHPEAGAGAFRKMAIRNLADPYPPALAEWILYSHPPIGKRVRAAERYMETRAGQEVPGADGP